MPPPKALPTQQGGDLVLGGAHRVAGGGLAYPAALGFRGPEAEGDAPDGRDEVVNGRSRIVTVTKTGRHPRDPPGRYLVASHLPETFSDWASRIPRPTTPAPSPHATPHWQAHLSQRSECGSDPPHPERDSDAAGKTGRQDRGGSAKPLPRLAGL